jgi:hypothetical protein
MQGLWEDPVAHSFVSCRRHRLKPLTPRGPVLTREPQDADLARGSHPPIELAEPAFVHWSADEWRTRRDTANGTDRVRDPHRRSRHRRAQARRREARFKGVVRARGILRRSRRRFLSSQMYSQVVKATRISSKGKGAVHGNRYHGRRSGAIVRPHRSSIKSQFATHDTDLRNGGIAASIGGTDATGAVNSNYRFVPFPGTLRETPRRGGGSVMPSLCAGMRSIPS